MTHSIRPTFTFVVRLWREPGAPGGDTGWRGTIRLLDRDAAASAVTFDGLGNLLPALRRTLAANASADDEAGNQSNIGGD